MSESKDKNLDKQYENIVKNQENETPKEPTDLGSINMDRFKQPEGRDADIVLGYHNISVNTLPSSGMFYPKGTQISIRSAKVAEIRHFSSIDENSILDVDEKLNAIVESCSRVTSDKKRMSYKDLCEEDRFFLILSIRDLTFPEPESNLSVDHKDKKGKKHKVEVKKDNFTYFKVPESLDKYYSEEDRTFLIETKSFGTIHMHPPTIGIMQKMTGYIKDRQDKGESIDQSVLQIMPYLVSEWRGFQETDIFKFEVEMNGWSNKKFSLVYKLAEQMKVGIKPDMRVQLGDDWEDVPIGFRDGIKSLFIVQDIAGELL
jgi:hypothetical protein|tara:strand:+ start:174 stop:1121 length:948 start_codon:yes stop_codon:yes gene_type:complete